MTRQQILEAKEDPRSKSDELIEWECKRAAYFAGQLRKSANRPLGQYFVKRLQSEFSDGYNGVHRSDLENFEQFVKVNTNH